MVTANPHGDWEAYVEAVTEQADADQFARDAALRAGRRGDHEYLPSNDQQLAGWVPHRWVIEAIVTAVRHAQTAAYAEGRKDQAEDQPIPDRALKLLDECMFYCQQAMEKHMDEEDRRGMASGLHQELREYLLDVGYIWKGKA